MIIVLYIANYIYSAEIEWSGVLLKGILYEKTSWFMEKTSTRFPWKILRSG